MKADQLKWDKRYRENKYPTHPSRILERFYNQAQKGRVLDIASGNGRNAYFLAKQQFVVEAVDISLTGYQNSDFSHPNLQFIQTDLDHFTIQKNHYSLIVNINFLNRDLFEWIIRGLKPEGVLIFQTFINPDSINGILSTEQHPFYLEPNELQVVFKALRLIYYSETRQKIINGKTFCQASYVGVKDY